MEKADEEHDDFANENFIDKPAVLDKYKAAAQVTNCKLGLTSSGSAEGHREVSARHRYRGNLRIWRFAH
jgi:hypothetical protein